MKNVNEELKSLQVELEEMKEEYDKYLPVCGVNASNRPTHELPTFEPEQL